MGRPLKKGKESVKACKISEAMKVEHASLYLEQVKAKKTAHERRLFEMIAERLKTIHLAKEYKIAYVLTRDVIEKVFEKIQNTNSKLACRGLLTRFVLWLKKEKRLSQEYELPEIKIDKSNIKPNNNVYLISFNPLVHVNSPAMQFASLLFMTYGLSMSQLLNVKREDYSKEMHFKISRGYHGALFEYTELPSYKPTDTIKIKGIKEPLMLTEEMLELLKLHPEIMRNGKYTFSNNGKKIIEKKLNRWLKKSLNEKYKGKITFQKLKTLGSNKKRSILYNETKDSTQNINGGEQQMMWM
jgi:hypothetical protein